MFGDKIKLLRENHGYSMDSFIELYNKRFNARMNKSTLSRYERELQDPIYTVVKNIAEFYNVSIDYLLTDREPEKQYKNIMPIEVKKVPFLGAVACGEPIFREAERESYCVLGAEIGADFCLECVGDSMINARINNGDIVFCRRQEQVENGEIAVVAIGDEATLKRVVYYPEKNMLILKPENPRFQDMIYTDEALNDIRILGKAVAFQSDVY